MIIGSLITILIVFGSHAAYSWNRRRQRCLPGTALDLRGCNMFIRMNEDKAWIPELEALFANKLTEAGARIILLPEGDPFAAHDKIKKHAPYRMLVGDLVTIPIQRNVGPGRIEEIGAHFQLVVRMIDHGQEILHTGIHEATFNITTKKSGEYLTEKDAFNALTEEMISTVPREHWYDN